MSAQWAVGAAEMRRTSHSKRAGAPLQGALATIENAEVPLRFFFSSVPSSLIMPSARQDPIYGIRKVNLAEVNAVQPYVTSFCISCKSRSGIWLYRASYTLYFFTQQKIRLFSQADYWNPVATYSPGPLPVKYHRH